MVSPLLETKLYAPRPRDGAVTRPRLVQHLEQGTRSRLVVVSAPAGFGKSTLMAQWLEERARARTGAPAVAWVSLDAGDNQPRSFWSYLATAVQRAAAGVGERTLALLSEARVPPAASLLTPLLNDIASLTEDVFVVLDDYHVIDAGEIHQGIAFLIDRAPAQLHLVLLSRADPPLPLARLRARGELVELRAADLRFTLDEVRSYLDDADGPDLGEHQVEALEARTEGWIAALQLAALSLRGRTDASAFIEGFAGDDRYVVDYLVEEVLQQQSEDVADFLLTTSVLDRFTGPLCDAVTGGAGGTSLLERLDRHNLFLVPLDDRRRWYRYHHLFAEALRARLLSDQPDVALTLHCRASDWFEQHGDRDAAIDHAVAGEAYDRAAELIELATPQLLRNRRESEQRRWIELLPDQVVEARPVLCTTYVGALLSSGVVAGVERWLQVAERWAEQLRARPSDDVVAADPAALAGVPTWAALYRAAFALITEDLATVVTSARRGRELAPPDDHLAHGAASALLGLAALAEGELDTAHAWYSESTGRLLAQGHVADVLGATITLADIRVTQGRLGDAMRTFEEALQIADEHAAAAGTTAVRGSADMYVGMGAVHLERDDLAAARECLRHSEDLGDHLALPQNPYRWHVAMARLAWAEGHLEDADQHFSEAERLYNGDFQPEVRPVAALRARLWLAQGRVDAALQWARDRGLSIDDDLAYRHELEHVTLARAHLAGLSRPAPDPSGVTGDQVAGFLRRLLTAADAGGRQGTVIELLVLQAALHQARGDLTAATASLRRALALGAPGGYVRVYLEAGSEVQRLLRTAAVREAAPEHVREILAGQQRRAGQPSALAGTVPVQRSGAYVEPLSERERDVLRLLGTELAGPEIARELVLSLNTVRTHTRNIYTKLGVGNRRAAVRRAEELGLLAGHRHH